MDYSNEKKTSNYAVLPFDPIVLLRELFSRWALILLITVAVGVGTYIASDMSYRPVYQTSTTFVVTTKGSSSTVYTNLTSTNGLATVFTELLNSSMMKKIINQEMGTSFNGTIDISVIAETNLISMKVRASDPRTAYLAARAIIENHEAITYKVVDNIALEVLQHPVVPTAPVNHIQATGRMEQMMRIALVLSVLLMTLQICAQDTVRSEKEAQEKLNCAFLGEIPHERKYKTFRTMMRQRKTSILITKPLASFQFVEAVRKLRRRVEKRMHTGKVLMVTSLLENEGKSTVAVNLALALEQAGKRVLLIDCDLRKPACHMILEQKSFRYGLLDVLQDRAELLDALVPVDHKDLYLLLQRKGSARESDLLSFDVMRDLLDWARNQVDYCILDMPPILVSSDAESMKELADASILVVRQGAAERKALNKAIVAMDGGRAKMIGCVLNNAYSSRILSGHGYGYGYYGKYKYYGKKNG